MKMKWHSRHGGSHDYILRQLGDILNSKHMRLSSTSARERQLRTWGGGIQFWKITHSGWCVKPSRCELDVFQIISQEWCFDANNSVNVHVINIYFERLTRVLSVCQAAFHLNVSKIVKLYHFVFPFRGEMQQTTGDGQKILSLFEIDWMPLEENLL